MNIIFRSVSASAPDNYVSEKLQACRRFGTPEEIAKVAQSVGKKIPSLTPESKLPPFTSAQSSVIEINKNEVLNNLSTILPPLPGETNGTPSFAVLAENFEDYPAGAPVMSVESNFSTIDFIFRNYLLENGVLKQIPSLPSESNNNSSESAEILGVDGDIIGDLLAKLVQALINKGIEWFKGQIANQIFGDFFQSSEVKQLEKYVNKAIEDNNILNQNRRLQDVLEWIADRYSDKTALDDLQSKLDNLTLDIMPILPPYLAALPVYVVAANTALLICQRMDELDPSGARYDYYAPRFTNITTQLLRTAFDTRASYVKLQSYGWGAGAQYSDSFNGKTGNQFAYANCPSEANYKAVTLQAEYSKLQYISGAVYDDFSTLYKSCIDSVQTWAKAAKLPVPVFNYKDRLYGMTNDYLRNGGGLISAGGKYCFMYIEPLDLQIGLHPFTQGGYLIIFNTQTGNTVWQTETYAMRAWRAYMQQDCNFVSYGSTPEGWSKPDANQLIWDLYNYPPGAKSDQFQSANSTSVFSSNTFKGEGPLDYFLIMQDDGNLCIYPTNNPDPANVVWATNSNQP